MKLEINAEEKQYNHETKDSKPQTEEYYEAPLKQKGRVSGCLAMILTVLYAGYLLVYFSDVGSSSIGGALASALVAPHMLCAAIAAVFSFVGFFGKKRWAMLTSGILMVAAAVLFTTYAPMVIIQAVLFFISYARMK